MYSLLDAYTMKMIGQKQLHSKYWVAGISDITLLKKVFLAVQRDQFPTLAECQRFENL